ncbi:unnamed protein product [Bursaphelenchus xylophilus]|uniref:(pine wood nematode) hypothetical protein n=1 Tax=Bursaphelenchus xylophilus TaxID=6326 RepID=A0A1I7ST39_BURXY|nr:unnamed protein product [Bursaphelenchus xylophilus]CAG9108751.1 unnamed protein product [Bursaphelenchus xylophilus]
MEGGKAMVIESNLPKYIDEYMKSCVDDVDDRMAMKSKIKRIYRWTKVLGKRTVRNALKIIDGKRIAVFHDEGGRRPSFFKVGNETSWHPVNKIRMNAGHCNCYFFREIVMTESKAYLCQHLTALRIVHALNIKYYSTTKDLTKEI